MNKNLLLPFLMLIPAYSSAALESFIEIPITNNMMVYPTIDINLKNNDNIFLADNIPADNGNRVVYPKKNSLITEINPEIVLKGRNGLHNWELAYRGEYGIYKSSTKDNYNDHLIRSRLHLEGNSRHQFDFGFDLSYLHENRGSGLSDNSSIGLSNVRKNPDTYRDTRFNADYTFGADHAKGKIIIDSALFDRSYTNNQVLTARYDRKEADLGATFYYRLSPKTSLVFLGKFKKINYQNSNYDRFGSLDSTEQRYEAGITWRTSAKTRGTATIGQTYKDFSSNLRQDNNFTSWEVSSVWLPKTYSRIELTANSRPVETNGSGSFRKRNSFITDWEHHWSSKTSTHLNANFTSNRYQGASRSDTIMTYQAEINYQLRRALKFGLSYGYANRNSNIAGFDYNNKQIMLSSQLGID